MSNRRNFIRNVTLTATASMCLPMPAIAALPSSGKPKTKVNQGMTFLFQGDSITDGNRGRNSDQNHIMGHGYAFSIASRLGADFPEKKLIFYNRGISGNKANDLVKRWQTDTLDLKPDVLSILVGVNDASSMVFHLDPAITVEKYEEIYTVLLDQTLAQFPTVVIVLCEPFILEVGRVKENWEAYHSDIVGRRAAVKKLANQYDAVFVGLQEVFDKACMKAAPDYWIWDGVHPTVPGHELIARAWLHEVRKRISFK